LRFCAQASRYAAAESTGDFANSPPPIGQMMTLRSVQVKLKKT